MFAGCGEEVGRPARTVGRKGRARCFQRRAAFESAQPKLVTKSFFPSYEEEPKTVDGILSALSWLSFEHCWQLSWCTNRQL